MGTAQQINAYHRTLPFIEIMDSTLRDGEQTSTVSFLPHEKLVMARKLLKAVNVDRIEVASARVSDGEKEAVTMICKAAQQMGRLDSVEVLGFVDGGKSVDWIADSKSTSATSRMRLPMPTRRACRSTSIWKTGRTA